VVTTEFGVPDQRDELSETLGAISRLLIAAESVDRTLSRIASLACQALDACDMAGVTLLRDGKPATIGHTDDTILPIDRAQYETGAGPCLDSYRERRVFRVDSTADDNRWPAFSRAAAKCGILSTMSIPLVAHDEELGALNLYSRTAGSFSDDDERLGLVLAEQASVAIANAEVYWRTKRVTTQLEQALLSRDLIGQAKGILMAREGFGADQAFDVLKRASQRSNRKLREVAEEIVQSAERRGAGGDHPRD
jgi:GAF domain-containing protein